MDRLEVKATLAVDQAGTITGTAWPFGSPDSVGDIITRGAFNIAVKHMPILFGHDPSDLVGTWNTVAETADALVVEGKLHMDRPRSQAVHGLLSSKLVTGLSIGFIPTVATKQGRNRIISACDLLEVSVVRNPAHPRARISAVKSQDSAAAIAEAIRRATSALFSPK